MSCDGTHSILEGEVVCSGATKDGPGTAEENTGYFQRMDTLIPCSNVSVSVNVIPQLSSREVGCHNYQFDSTFQTFG